MIMFLIVVFFGMVVIIKGVLNEGVLLLILEMVILIFLFVKSIFFGIVLLDVCMVSMNMGVVL